MPKSTFFSDVSWRYALIKPNRGSSGALGTRAAVKTEGLVEPMMWDETWDRRSRAVVEGRVEDGEDWRAGVDKEDCCIACRD